MAERDGYIAGVPSWVDTQHPDPEAAAVFYAQLFGWTCEDMMPADAGTQYFIARIRGRDVAGIGAVPEGAPPMATWNTYIAVESADETATKVQAAGGKTLTEPFDVMDAGRMAVFQDPEGAVFCVWQAKQHKGAAIVNEHGSLNFNNLNTRDIDGARAFYGAVFGWQTRNFGGFDAWILPSYGDHLEAADPGLRQRTAEMGVPGFEEVVAAIVPITGEQGDVPPHWSVTFMVDDAIAIAEKVSELGGRVVVAPFDAPWVRSTVIADPQGAMFIASQFVPENRDVAASADASVGAA
jgi:uncharacterized protein